MYFIEQLQDLPCCRLEGRRYCACVSAYEPLNPNRIHLTILGMCPGVGLREFAFDGVFGPKVKKGWLRALSGFVIWALLIY
jgi:hypothetical protein